MAETSESYRTKVGVEQDAETIFIREDGALKFFDVNFSGLFMRNHIASRNMMGYEFTSVVLSNLNSQLTSVGTIVGALSNDIPGGNWNFTLDTGLSLFSMSAPLCSGNSGVRLILRGTEAIADANVLFLAGSVSGCSVIGLNGDDLSSLNLSADFYVEMVADGGATWQIVDRNGSATEQVSS